MTFAVYSKGFVLFGLNGFVSFFEKTDDKRDPFVETKRLVLGLSETFAPAHPGMSTGPTLDAGTSRSEVSLSGQSDKNSKSGKNSKNEFEIVVNATILPSEENIIMLTKTSRVLTLPLNGIDIFSSNSAAMSLNNSIDGDEGHPAGAHGVSAAYSAQSSPLTDLYFGGNHQQRVMGVDVAYQRPIAVSIAHDCTLRVWNYENLKCELSYEFTETPYAVAVMASGFQVIVSFKDKIRMYNILQDKLRHFRETTLKGCKELKLSHNNSTFAAAAALSVYVYDSKTFQQLLYLQGHIGQVRKLCWGPGDQTLFSSGADGNIYGWSMTSDLRIDVSTSSNNRSSPILCLDVDGQTPGIIGTAIDKRNGRIAEDWLEGGQLSKSLFGPNSVIIGFSDGVMKACEYSGLIDVRTMVARSDTNLNSTSVQYDIKSAVTAVCISSDKKSLYCGLANGCVRAYPWPFMQSDPPYVEVSVHAASVVDIREVPAGTAIITISEDGTVFYVSTLKGDMMSFGGMEMSALYSGGLDVPMNSDLVLATREDIEEHVTEVQDLQKKLVEAVAKTDYAKHNLELVHAEEVRRIVESHHMAINAEKDRYETLQSSMDNKIIALKDTIRTNEQDHIKTAAEIENRYEHKLADQFERYDRLSEEMEAINQKCQGLLSAERAESERLMSDLRADNRHREKKLKADFKRVRDERATDENAFKEILDQQEDEYENELKQLIAAAEDELRKERETITKYQTFAQTQTTKLDQYNKRYKEVQEEYKKGLEELKLEKKEKLELVEAVEHYKKNLAERDAKLADKDKLILELRSNIRTLENFRVVLDHRQQQLNAEKGPITEHIVGLENHIRTMYEELVEEFEAKKAGAMETERKDLKLAASSHEVARLRAENKQKEVYISAFKRDVENIIGSFGQKEMEEAVLKLYKKYVKGDDNKVKGKERDDSNKKSGASKTSALASKIIHNDGDSDDDDFNFGGSTTNKTSSGTGNHRPSISKAGKKKRKKEFIAELNAEFLDNAKEANRQRAFIERSAADLKHRLDLASLEQVRSSQRRLHENSHLVYECNELRAELKTSARKLKIALEEKDRLMVALANTISSQGNKNVTQIARNMLKNMTAGNIVDDTVSITSSALKDTVSIHSKTSHMSIDSRKLRPPNETPVDELVNKANDNKFVVEDKPTITDDDDGDMRSLTSTGADQKAEADKWWESNGGTSKPSSAHDSRRASKASNIPSSPPDMNNSYSTNALPGNASATNKIALSRSTPALVTHARIPNGGKPSSKGALSSLMLPALPSEDLGSMSDLNPHGRPLAGGPSAVGLGGNAGRNQLLARRTNPTQTISQKVGTAHNQELKLKRASKEIEHLSKRLDESEKEKIVQQAEINRLRNQAHKMGTACAKSPGKRGGVQNATMINQESVSSSTFIGSNRGDGLYPPEMQTNADTTGVPSNEDLDQLRVSSAKGSARGLRKSPSNPETKSPQESAVIAVPVSSADVVKRPSSNNGFLPPDDELASLNSSLSAGSARYQ